MKAENINSSIPSSSSEELFDPLFESNDVRIERIISFGQSTPPGVWLDQPHDEWVMVVEGSATLLLYAQESSITMNKGDHLFIPAYQKHRVQGTDQQHRTIWLAVHIKHSDNAMVHTNRENIQQ